MEWRALFVAFITVFLAEIGDKTQLMVVSLAAQHPSPWMVWLGASLALIAATTVGVAVAQWLSLWVPAGVLRIGAGVLFILLGVLMILDVI
ncbi:MAG: TMEM165/GDT1 family protein [Acidobacteria bacterium]|nr:TMEM165/GDT1 family protein [Acidobacteriota bacterium]MDW7983424.1 TMEM165/GDT1 family protein [Acidobacteriota bacterium]